MKFDNDSKAFALRRSAQQQDLRNRFEDAEWPDDLPLVVRGTMEPVREADGRPRCECGNLLTIADSGYRCRQCVLLERMYGKGK